MISTTLSSIAGQWKAWLAAGLAATLVLALLMEGLARAVLGGPMKPAVLICQVFGWDQSLLWLGEILHYALGLVGFPVGYVVLRSMVAAGPGWLVGAGWGLILFVGAGAVMAPAAGLTPFFGGGTMMVASLIAHLAYGFVLGAVFARFRADTA
ncbi:MAG: DUF6789 family protein [Pseudomonadota bacterium]